MSSSLSNLPKPVRDANCMTVVKKVGEGTYGDVFKAIDKETGDFVALKRIKMSHEKEGFPFISIREIKILKALNHVNIVHFKEMITCDDGDSEASSNKTKDKDSENNASSSIGTVGAGGGTSSLMGDVFMVFEFCDFDLAGLIKSDKVHLSDLHIKSFTKQLLSGVHYMHTKKVLHRDIKGPNLLITRDNVLKIADWGLSRTAPERNQKLTNGNRIVSLWWRAPELLLGSHDYGPEIDIWSVGCVFGEMKAGQAMLQGKDVINQLELIYQLMGSPTGEVEQKYKEMPNWEQMIITRQYPNRLRKVYENIFLDNHALDLLEKLLDLNPKGTNPVGGGPAVGGRITATKALDEPYFWSGEIAPDPRELPRFNIDGVTDMIEAERRREEHAAREEQRKIALEALEEKAKREKERSTVAGAGAKSGGLPPRGKAKPLEIKSGAAKYTLVKKNSSVPSNLSSLSATSSSSEQTDTSTSILKAKATPMDAPRNAGGYKRPRPDDQK